MNSNDLSKDINKRLAQSQPSLRMIGKWREEWKAKGLDFKMSFQSYKKYKCKEWHKKKYVKKRNKNK